MKPTLILFTDLDGTLLDHHTYSAARALPAVRQLTEKEIPLVFCSSKTPAEQAHLQKELGLLEPFIFENGSGAAIPEGYFDTIDFSRTEPWEGYILVRFAWKGPAELREILAGTARNTGIELRSFADATDDELGAATGLSGEALLRARDRRATATLLSPLAPAQVAAVEKELDNHGLSLSRGGRFFTVQDAGVSKGRAMQWLAAQFQNRSGAPVITAATGDSPNDAPMLEKADHAFLVQRPDGSWTELAIPGLKKVAGIGPAGFSAAVQILLNEKSG